MRRFLASSLVALLVALAIHENAHRVENAPSGIGPSDPPCPICAQITSASVPDFAGTRVPDPVQKGEVAPPRRIILPSEPCLSESLARGPPA